MARQYAKSIPKLNANVHKSTFLRQGEKLDDAI